MSACKAQTHLDVPVEEIWELIGDPKRHPEWWPRVVEVNGERFEEGSEYVQVTRTPTGRVTTDFVVERKQDLREIKMRCLATGTYAHWLMTEARGGTFLDVEFGMDPKGFSDKLFDGTFGRIFFRRWLERSVEALRKAARGAAAGAPR